MKHLTLFDGHRFLRLTLALCFTLAIPGALGAQEGIGSPPNRPVPPLSIDIKVFTKHTSALPNNLVDALLPLPDGTVWVGTNAGLAGFHQGQWQVYTKANSKLSRNWILSLAAQPDGVLWVGTDGGGLIRLHKGKLEVFTHENSGLPGNEIHSLALGPDGALWVSSSQSKEEKRADGTIVRLSEFESHVSCFKNGAWQVFSTGKDLGFRIITVGAALRVTPEGAVWAMNSFELSRYHQGRWERQKAGLPELPEGQKLFDVKERFKCLKITSDGVLWVGTTAGLSRYAEGSWQLFTTANSGLPDNKIDKLAATPDGALWAGTEKSGLARYFQGQWQIFTSENSSLPDNRIRMLESTPDGTLWVGTPGGLACQYQGLWGVLKNLGLPDMVYRKAATAPDGSLWIGTTDSGLARVSRSPWQVFTQENSGLPDNEIKALAFGLDGALWVATEKSGLTRYQGGRWQRFTRENSGLPDNEVSALAITADGALWAKNPAGVTRFHQGQWQTFKSQDCPLLAGYGRLAATPDGALWVGTRGGLARYNQGRWQVLTPENSSLPFNAGVEQLTVGPDGVLWVHGSYWRKPPQGIGIAHSLARLVQGQWQIFPPSDFGGPAMAVTAKGDVWLGSVRRSSQGHYDLFDTSNSGLPHRFLSDVKIAPDDALWAATAGGLARYSDGQWQTFTPQNSGMAEKAVWRLTVAADGVIWGGTTGGGLVRFEPPIVRPLLVELVPASRGEKLTFSQTRQTFAARAFDPTFRTDPQMFRYTWVVRQNGQTAAKPEYITDSPFFSDQFDDGQDYTLEVRGVDKYGYRSDPKEVHFRIALPQPLPKWQQWLRVGGVSAGLLSLAYLFLLPPLIMLYPRSSLARTAVNSGVFNKFPLIHKTILNSRWARAHLFYTGAKKYLQEIALPRPYIPQAVYGANDQALPIHLEETDKFFNQRCTPGSHALLLGRSGTGKSVLLRYLLLQALERFLTGKARELPLLIDLRTHPLAGRQLEEVIVDELKGHGVELPDEVLRFWLKKGGFLLLLDSLNEVDSKVIGNELQAFLNRDFHNRIVMASQLDLLKRRDLQVYHLFEVSSEQARDYMGKVVGRDIWDRLPPEVQVLARNPQDLTLLGEVLQAAAPEEVPTHRAALYSELLKKDTALAAWVESDSAEIRAIYELAFGMVNESRRVLREDELAGLLRPLLEARQVAQAERVVSLAQGLERSRMFRREQELLLGLKQRVIGFAHELLGKFLASRHLRTLITDPTATQRQTVLNLTAEPRWMEVCFFALDELPPAGPVLERFLLDLLGQGGTFRLRLVAYALGTRPPEAISQEVREAYNQAKIAEDLRETPATIIPAVMASTITMGPPYIR